MMTPILAIGFLGTGLLGLIVAAALALSAFMADPTIPGPMDEQLRLDAAAGAAATVQTASTNSTALDMGSGFAPSGIGQPVAAVIQVTAVSGTTPTMAPKLQESSDNSAWTDCGAALANITAAGTYVAKGVLAKRYIRLATTIGGTTPSFTFKAWLNPRPVG